MLLARRALSLLLFCLAVAPFSLPAQQLSGSITGTVTDATGSVIPGASVAVKNLDTNLEVKVNSFANGSYLVPNLPPGNYSVSISQASFKTETHTSVLVEANRTATVNGRLEVGAVATTVEVSATPLMNQVDTTNGYVLSEQSIVNTPLGTGSFTQLAILSPGVSADLLSGSGSNAGLGNQSIWANGQRDTSNSFSVNGVANNNLFNGKSTSTVASTRFTAGTGAVSNFLSGGDTQTSASVYDSIGNSMGTPAPETMQELRVNTAMYDASEGSKSGAHITAITKSGTNNFHGQAYEHFQNNDMNAAEFFRNSSPAIAASDKVPALHYNRFGGTLGGPLVHDKLFFFVAYNGIQDHDNLNGGRSITVPLHLTDDRSATALANIAQLDFAKTIAPSAIDPAALKILNYKVNGQYLIPSAQITDSATAVRLGYDAFLQAPSTFSQNQIVGNLDYNISNKDRLTEKFLYQNNPTYSPFSGSNTLGFTQQNQASADSFVIDNTTILNPALTWEQKAGFVRMISFVQTQQPLQPSDVGMNVLNSTSFPGTYIVQMDKTLNKTFQIGTQSPFGNAGTFQNQYTYATNINWVKGRHTIYAGVNLDQNQLNIINHNNGVGSLEFADFTTFLQGALVSSGSNAQYNRFFYGASNRYYRATLAGAFIQDNIHISSNFSVSLGLRYDYSGPFSEKYGNLVNFHPDQYHYDASTDTVTSTGLVIAGNNKGLGTAGVSDSTLDGRQWGLAPRIGVVWSPSGLKNIVFRGGFGLFYDRGEYFTELSPPAGTGFNGPFGVTLAPPFVQQINPNYAVATLDNPFAGATIPAPVTSANAFAGLVPNAASLLKGTKSYLFGGYDNANVLPYTENWSFDMQWQPVNSINMTLGYVGNRSLHQVLPIPFNQPGIATASNPIHGEIYSYGYNVPGIAVETDKTYDGGNIDLRTPFLGLSNNSILYKAEGIADYNALQFGIRKRMSHGLQFVGNYTWSHTLDEQSGLGLFYNGNDPNNIRSSYGTSTYDRTHVITVQSYYELPHLGSGKTFVGKLANGWGISGISVLQSGFPYNAYDYSGSVGSVYYGAFDSVVDPLLPLKPGVTVKQAQLQGSTGFDINKPFIDSTAFYAPALNNTPQTILNPGLQPGTSGVPACVSGVCDNFENGFGNTSRNTFRGPMQFRFDATVVKLTDINDRFKLRFEADAFNVLNHPSFDTPNSGSAGLYSSANPPVVRSFLSSFGLVQHTIGSPRFLQLSLSLMF